MNPEKITDTISKPSQTNPFKQNLANQQQNTLVNQKQSVSATVEIFDPLLDNFKKNMLFKEFLGSKQEE